MAKKRLTTAIEKLVNSLDSLPPEFRQKFKQEAMAILPLSKALEDGSAICQAETQITSLEEQIAKLELQLNESNKEVEAFRAEQKEREKKDADLPKEQVELLRILQPESLGLMPLSEILDSISLREDEVVWHLGKLKELKLADFSHHAIGYQIWYRTELGNIQVIARRMAERGDLPDIAEKILAELSPPGRAPGRADWTAAQIAFLVDISEDLALSYLERLHGAGFAIRAYTSKGTLWSRHPDGTEYLKAKRLAGEEQKKRYKHADLPPIQHEILLLIAAGQDDGANENGIAEALKQTLGLIRFNLKELEALDMAADPGEPDYGAGRVYYLRDTGAEYLAERDQL
jgi:hypothetical protein